jgi:hypothetical protein
MYRKRFSLLAAAMVCVALVFLSTPRLADAERPETVELMLGLLAPYFPYEFDPIPELPYYVREDTIAILIGESPGVWDKEYFCLWSPAVGRFDDVDGEVEVAGTNWFLCADATIVNKGGWINSRVLVNSNPPSPAHYPLLFDKITEVHTSWIRRSDSGACFSVQEFWNYDTCAVFIVVKGEFRVKK